MLEIVAIDPFHGHDANAVVVQKIVDIEQVILLDQNDACRHARVNRFLEVRKWRSRRSSTGRPDTERIRSPAAIPARSAGDPCDTASTPNRIEMLGALRATKQCMQCHQVPSGTLLGAFSYELRRDPPIKVAAPKVVPVQ